jgi:hypothetical protein
MVAAGYAVRTDDSKDYLRHTDCHHSPYLAVIESRSQGPDILDPFVANRTIAALWLDPADHLPKYQQTIPEFEKQREKNDEKEKTNYIRKK